VRLVVASAFRRTQASIALVNTWHTRKKIGEIAMKKVLALTVLAGILLGLASSTEAQIVSVDGNSSAQTVQKALDARFEALEQQLERLTARLQALEKPSPPSSVLSANESDDSQESTQLFTVADQIESLDQKIRIAERRQEIDLETAAAAAKAAPLVMAGRDGFTIKSADSAFAFNLHGNLQADSRYFPNGSPSQGASTLTITKVRPTFDGTICKNFAFKIMPDFGSGSFVLQDAYIDSTFRPWLKFRGGKFKGPVGLERLVADQEVEFYERFLPTNLVPNRDVGAQIFGDGWGGVVSYAGGIFNGVPDGSSTDLDTDNHREFEGRVFLHPFRRTQFASLQSLGVGIGGSSGSKTGTASIPVVATYRTTSQQTFFRYRSDGTAAGTTVADGAHTRISPQLYYYWGPFGAWSEYVLSSQDVRRGPLGDTIDNSAWQVAATYVLTGEPASYRSVTPREAFDLKQHHWGALELAVRYGRLRVDRSAFPFFADPTGQAAGVRSWTVGANWYVNKNVKLVLNYEQTNFDQAFQGIERKQERAILERLQLAF
jgi:phosphate-selective porin OprO and OprP